MSGTHTHFLMTYDRWSKSSTVPLGLTVTLLTSLCSPSRRKRRNSWASCWLRDAENSQNESRRPMWLWGTREKWTGSLLVSHESGSVSLDLRFEFRRADRLTAGRRPHGLYQLGKFCQNRNTQVTHTVGMNLQHVFRLKWCGHSFFLSCVRFVKSHFRDLKETF